LASDGGDREHPLSHASEEAQALQKAIANFTARLDPTVFSGEVGIVVAIINLGSPTETTSSQQEALETQGFTCETLAAYSVQDARRLHLLLAGFPTVTVYGHTLRPGFTGPSGWFSFDTLESGEVVQLLCRCWGIVPPIFPQVQRCP